MEPNIRGLVLVLVPRLERLDPAGIIPGVECDGLRGLTSGLAEKRAKIYHF